MWCLLLFIIRVLVKVVPLATNGALKMANMSMGFSFIVFNLLRKERYRLLMKSYLFIK